MDRTAALLLAEGEREDEASMLAGSVLAHTDTELGAGLFFVISVLPAPSPTSPGSAPCVPRLGTELSGASRYWEALFKGSRESVSRKLGR